MHLAPPPHPHPHQHQHKFRESLGICPQFDILWPDITAQEHLQLYALLKGARGWREAAAQAQAAAAEVGGG